MKSNNALLYVFIVIVIGIIAGATYFIYNGNKETDNEEETNEITSDISVVENLKVGITDYDTLNPIITQNKEVINYDKLIFEPLLEITSDYNIGYNLAKEFTQKSDTQYEIVVDTSIKWQDGSTLSANDVEFTINKIKENNSVYSDNVAKVDNVEVVDDSTILINLSSKVTFFEYNLTFPIVSSAYYEGENFAKSSKIPMGTGMFKIASIGNDNILLVQNERWHKISEAQPKTQSITIHKYSAMGEIFNAFKLGNIDVVDTHLTNYSEYVGSIGYNQKVYSEREYDFIALNCKDSILSDTSIRQAISYALNKENVISTATNNGKISTKGSLDYGSYLSNTDDVPSYNEDKAKTILEEAGWSLQNDIWSKKINGATKRLNLTLTVNEEMEERVAVAEAIKKQLKEFGINITIQKVSKDKYYEQLNKKSYQMIFTGITNSVNPDLSYFYGKNNIANYSNDEVSNNLNNYDKYSDIQKIANQECPYIPLYRNKGTLLLNPNMGGDFQPNAFNIFNNFQNWYRQQ